MIDYAGGYGPHDRKKLKGIRGPLIAIGSWNVTCILIFLAGYTNVSQIKVASVLSRHIKIPEPFFNVASIGYMALLIVSILTVFTFFAKMKIYKYMELFGLACKGAFLYAISRSLEGGDVAVSALSDLVPLSIYVGIVTVLYLFFSYRVKNTFIK